MEGFRITSAGPLSQPLQGSAQVGGAKDSALKLMAAALLAPGRTVLCNVPDILDVVVMGQLLERLGCEVVVDHDAGRVAIDVPEDLSHEAPYELVRRLRASISVLGPLVARCGRAKVALPGGDNIGSRGLDMHVTGLEELGAEVHIEHGFVVAETHHGLAGRICGSTSPVWAPPRTSSWPRCWHPDGPSSTTSRASRRSPTSAGCSSTWGRGWTASPPPR